LIQRFVDNELTASEQAEFVEAVRADPAFGRTVERTVQTVRTSEALPREHASGHLVARVLQALPAARRSRWDAMKTAWLPPGLNWNLAQSVAMACLVAVLAWQVGRVTAPRTEPVSAGSEPVTVRLVMVHPKAESVSVAGDFNGWHPDATPLRRSADGYWSVSLPLKPGRYHYMFVVDGEEWVTDPFATDVSHDDFGADNAVLEVL
jgi:hypothetical protein